MIWWNSQAVRNGQRAAISCGRKGLSFALCCTELIREKNLSRLEKREAISRSGPGASYLPEPIDGETDIVRSILVAVSALPGAMFFRQNTGVFRTLYGRRVVRVAPTGIADIMGIYWSLGTAIEVKTLTGTARESQVRFRKAWERAGGYYMIARSPEQALSGLAENKTARGRCLLGR